MNRREFTRSLTVIACAGAGPGPAIAGIAQTGAVTHFVQDSRLAADDVSDWIVRLQPTHHHLFERDVTALWRKVLNEAWRDSHATAGVTRHAEFFVLSTLARDHGYRVAALDEQVRYVSWLLVRDGTPSGAHRDWSATRR